MRRQSARVFVFISFLYTDKSYLGDKSYLLNKAQAQDYKSQLYFIYTFTM